MIRSIVCAIVIVVAGAMVTIPAAAQDNKTFGLGFVVGEPTGIDAKFFLNSNDRALEFAAAWSLSGNNDFHLQGDYLFHRYGLFDLQNQDEMPLYFGVGVRMVLIENTDDVVGIRFPIGLAYVFANYPFDIFAAIVPILDVAPDTDFDLEGAIGARFWF
jgi:hypothetical protein